jgi:3D-(3,5/4)-trihydroxycyclohexane-1,2-dione acylhydrolase (decyclizing)
VQFFAPREHSIRRLRPEADSITAVAGLLAAAEKPLIIAGGGVIYSAATRELEILAERVGVPVVETFAGKGAVQSAAWWQVGGVGLEGNPAANALAREADFVLTIGSRLTDFITASQSLFASERVTFASINVNPRDADRLGATAIVGDARMALAELINATSTAQAPPAWRRRVEELQDQWHQVRAQALSSADSAAAADVADGDPEGGRSPVLTQGQVIGLLQEDAREGDVIIAAAGGPPGDLLKVWDATGGRHCHLEFGFSCMGYEIPASIGVRLATGPGRKRVLSLVGDGTFLMSPTEIVTAVQERVAVTIVVLQNYGYQVIRRLQMLRSGEEFGNEFRYRTAPLDLSTGMVDKQSRLEGGYITTDIVKVAAGLGAHTMHAVSAADVRAALSESRAASGPTVIVIPVVPHADLPGSGVWWDVAPAETSEADSVKALRAAYEADRGQQRWYG